MEAEEIEVEKDKPRFYFLFGFESHLCWNPGNSLVSDMKEGSYLSSIAIPIVFLSPQSTQFDTTPIPVSYTCTLRTVTPA